METDFKSDAQLATQARLSELVAELFDDDSRLDVLRRIRDGDSELGHSLFWLGSRGAERAAEWTGEHQDDIRSMAIEVFAMASPEIWREFLGMLIRGALASESASVRFTGVACAGRVRKEDRPEIWGKIESMSSGDPDSGVRNAALAFLDRRKDEPTPTPEGP